MRTTARPAWCGSGRSRPGPPRTPPAAPTRGHVLTVPDFVSTLLVEATIHLLDAGGTPPAAAVAHTRRVLEELTGAPLPPGSDAEVLRLR